MSFVCSTNPLPQIVYSRVQIPAGCSIRPGGYEFWGWDKFWVGRCCIQMSILWMRVSQVLMESVQHLLLLWPMPLPVFPMSRSNTTITAFFK